MNRQTELFSSGLFAAVASFLVFFPALFSGFLRLDDPAYVSENALVLQGVNWESIRWVFTHFYESMWAPLLWISYMIDSSIFGTEAWGYHLTNVCLHTANVVLLYILLVRTTKANTLALICSLLFGLHPLRVESVVWIAERKDVLSAFFWLASCNAYVSYVKSRAVGRYVVVLLLFVMGLLVKPVLVTLPAIFLLLDFWPLMRWSFYGGEDNETIGKLILEKVPLFILSAVFCVVAILAHAQGEALPGQALSVPYMRVPVNMTFYLQKMLLPLKLSVVYPRQVMLSPVMVTAWAGVLIVLSVMAIYAAKKFPYFLMGWAWFCVSILPVSGVIPFGIVDYADRFSYVPVIGLIIALAWMINGFVRSPVERRIAAGVVVVVVLLLSILTLRQVLRWKTTEQLLTYCLEHEPESSRMLNCLAYDRMVREDYSGAEELFQRGRRMHPQDIGLGLNYAELLRLTDRQDAAVNLLENLNKQSPDNGRVIGNMGVSAMLASDLDEAIAYFEESLTLCPDQIDMLHNLGRIYQEKGNAGEAQACYTQILRLNPKHRGAHERMLSLAVEQQDAAMGLMHVDALLRVDSQNEQYRSLKRFFNTQLEMVPR